MNQIISRNRRRILLALVGILAICTALIVSRPDRLSLDGALCAAAALAVALLPTAAQVLGRRAFGPLPILALAALFYVPFFIVPPFLIDVVWPDGAPIRIYGNAPALTGIDSGVMGIVLAGICALVAGMAMSRLAPKLPAISFPAADPARLAWAARAMIALHAAFWAVPQLSGLPSLGQLMHPSGLLAGELALVAALSRGFGRAETILVFAVLLPLRLISGITSGSLNNSLILVAAMGLLLTTLRPKALLPVIAAVVLGAALYTPVQTYRMRSWHPGFETISFAGRLGLMADAFTNPQSLSIGPWWPYSDRLRAMAWPLIKRFDQTTVLGIVAMKTPSEIAPWDGVTEINLLTGMIPRMLWSEKPLENIGNRFGLRYGLLAEHDRSMSVNLPWLTEFYANHLLPGVAIGMALVGMVLGLLERSLNRPGASPLESAFAVAVMMPFLVPESNISLMIGNLPSIGLLLWFLLRLSLGWRMTSGGRAS